MFRLMIKQHKDTRLKYLCITKRKDYKSYLGSGKYWLNHIKKHGLNIETTVLFESDDYDIFLEQCYHYSEKYDVANSNDWANLIPENGYTGNFETFWNTIDEKTKKEIIKLRNKSIEENHWSKNCNKDEIAKRISNGQKLVWNELSEDDKLSRMEHFRSFQTEVSDETREKISKALIEYRKTPRSLHNLAISRGRLCMSDDAKAERKYKIQKTYSTGKHDALFERYSKERRGGNNPAAKAVVIENITYDSIKDAIEALGVSRSIITNRIKSKNWQNWKYK